MRGSISLAAAFLLAVPHGARAQSGWSQVQALTPGTKVIVSANGLPEAPRYFITADENSLTTLNISSVSTRVGNALREVMSQHPEYLAPARANETFVLSRGVHLRPDGVFFNGQRIADRAEVVDTIARTEISTLNTAAVRRSRAACSLAGYGGWIIGGFAGGAAGAAIASAVGIRSDAAGMRALFAGTMIGGATGSSWLYRKCRSKPEELIYQGP